MKEKKEDSIVEVEVVDLKIEKESSVFKVEEANREAVMPVDLYPYEKKNNNGNKEEGKSILVIPDLPISEVKEYGRKNKLEYSIPRFIGQNQLFICNRYQKVNFKTKKKEEQWLTMINPVILSTQGFVFSEEEQHGVEGVYVVPRHPRLLVAYVEPSTKKPQQKELMGKAAILFQQALQACNGIFINDFGLRVDDNEEYQKATDEEKAELVNTYLKALSDTLSKELEESPEVNEYVKATEWAAEKIEVDNLAREGVLPADIEKELAKQEAKIGASQ